MLTRVAYRNFCKTNTYCIHKITKMTPVKKAETTVRDSVCVNLKKIPVETLNMMNITSKKNFVRTYLIFESQRRYNDYKVSLRNDTRISRPITHTTSTDVIAVKSAMDSNRRHTLLVLFEILDMSYRTVRRIVTEELTMCLLNVRYWCRVCDRTDEIARLF